MSARGKLDLADVKSIARHAILPVIAAGAVEGLKAVNVATLIANPVLGAFATGAISAAIIALYRWQANLTAEMGAAPPEGAQG